MKKKIYQWHRTLSLIIALPVVLWAASGFMHPIMTNIRPRIATQGIAPAVFNPAIVKVNLEQALQQNHIDSFASFRLVHIDTNWFYQVQRQYNDEPVYLSVLNGKLLPQGDWLYAQYLAKQFLEGTGQHNMHGMHTSMPDMAAHDCCDAATMCVLGPSAGSQVTNASRITAFDHEYKSINRLLPVYKVSFNRGDGIRVYVETTQDRFAFAMDNRRAVFDNIFRLVHTWGWLDFLGKGKQLVEFVLVLTAFVTTLMGIYLFFTTKSKKANGNGLVKTRRLHRYVSIVAALFTLMFTFSGGYHALSKLQDDTRDAYYARQSFASTNVHFNLPQITAAVQQPITNISLVRMNGKDYWQVFQQAAQPSNNAKDLMKNMQVQAAPVSYVAVDDGHMLPDGEAGYARYLATSFSRHPANTIQSVTQVTKFNNEYNFTDKRLPVWKISYPFNGHERYYVETATGKLSVRINDQDLMEGYSFATLHKHEFLAWAGKPVKDFSTMFWAAAQVLMVTIGLVLYLKWRSRKRVSPSR